MDVIRVKLQLCLEYGSAVIIYLKCSANSTHTLKHNNYLKFVVFGIYIWHLRAWEYLHSK